MEQNLKKAGLAATALIVMGSSASIAAMPAFAQADNATAQAAAASESSALLNQSTYVSVPNVQGEFSYDQTTTMSNERIANVFRKASSIVCGAKNYQSNATAGNWEITVAGDVDAGFTATLDDIKKSNAATKKVMTCACSNNLAGGGAIATANVEGASIKALMAQAKAEDGVNTATFFAADGTEMSFSTDYLIKHNAVIAYEINGEAVSESVGGANQLWIEGASGKYFVRDVASVSFTKQDQAPADPVLEGGDQEYLNRPNVSAKASA